MLVVAENARSGQRQTSPAKTHWKHSMDVVTLALPAASRPGLPYPPAACQWTFAQMCCYLRKVFFMSFVFNSFPN